MPLLQVRGLRKSYGRREVVSGVDYDVERGEVVGLLGPNGAGKTTSFRMTIGLIDNDGGTVIFDERDVTKLPMYLPLARSRHGLPGQQDKAFFGSYRSGRQPDGNPRNPPRYDQETTKRPPE